MPLEKAKDRPKGPLADLLAKLVRVPKAEIDALERERPKKAVPKAS